MTLNGQDRQAPVILLSDQAARYLGPRIAQRFHQMPYRLVSPDQAMQDSDGTGRDIEIAFISRDVTGKSTKHELTESLQQFYRVLRAAPRLAWVHAHSAGADRPIYPELRGRGVTVTTSSGANAEAVAQMVLAGMLALNRRLPELLDAQRRRAWEPLLGDRAPRDLRGQTAVIVGLGPIGLETARLFKALHLRVIGVRRSDAAAPPCDQVLPLARLDEVLPQADWLVLACPLSADTRDLIDARRLALLPPGAQLINVARGEVAVEPDLIAALSERTLAGAFLDVYAHEPLADSSPLWALDNVVLSPHTAGHTSGHYAAVAEIFLDNLARWRDGRAMNNLVP
jgi:phosphoglycerate dehydrogenase-like enzyme